MSARFSFTGKLEVNTDSGAKGYYLREGKTSGKNSYKSINLQVIQEQNNRAYVELFGMKSDPIKTMDTDNNKIDVDWDNRFDDDVVKQVASYKKTVIKIDERIEFISSYDAIEYFNEHVDELKGQLVTITGTRSKNLYKDKLSDRFQISSIRVVSDEDVVRRLSTTIELFFDKSSFDTSEWNKEHKLYINGYTSEYISDLKENKYVPQQIVFDCSKIDFDNEKHRKLVDFRLKVLGCELDENNKVVIKLKSKNVYKMSVICTYVNGSEKLEFDENTLTKLQKEAIELGINTLDDFRPAGSLYGERVSIYKLRDFDMRKDSPYEGGCVDTEISVKEFEDEIWVATEAESVEDIDEDDDESSSNSENTSDDDDDLFD